MRRQKRICYSEADKALIWDLLLAPRALAYTQHVVMAAIGDN